jgi:DNA polymerase-2
MARGFILQPGYRIRDGVPVVQLYGRLESGDPFLVEDDRERPYFFTTGEAGAALAADRDVRQVTPTELLDLVGRPVQRVEVTVPRVVPHLRKLARAAGGEVHEADVRFAYRYLIDRDIRASVEIRGRGLQGPDGLVRYANPEVGPADGVVTPIHTLSLDFETTPDASRILSAALVTSSGVEEVHLVAPGAVRGAITHPEEPALIQALMARFRELDPDVILGWNVIDFDMAVLLKRCEALRMPAHFGRSRDAPRMIREPLGRRGSRIDVPGRVVLDGIPLVRDAIRLADYRLETVARHVTGRGKKIDHEAPDAGAEILRMYDEDPEALVAYNLEDARLVPEILQREGLLELALERSRLSGMPLDRIGASIASFDRLYLPELRRRGRVAPSVDAERKQALVKGGALLDPVPGFHERVAVLDFKSLYPSLIRTFQLDPLAHALADASGIEAPGGARFAREGAILPAILERFMNSRDEAKARGDRHADQAIKIMMNAFFGVLGAAACRFFDPGIANAITGFGQQTLHWTRDAFGELGIPVLYGDTDSVFVQLPAARDTAALGAAASELRREVEERVASRIRTRYGVEPQLELELEKIFSRFFLPRVRGGRGGSKKRYAGWLDGRLVIVGLESVRRDWPHIAQRLQEGVLERVFTDQDPAPFVAQLVDEVRRGERDDELVYVKRIRKGTVDSYATNAPHVQAARKAGRFAGRLIRYAITRTGPEPVLPGRPLPEGIDHRHYVEKVLRPVADSILIEMGSSFDEALGAPKQLSWL